MQRLQEKLYDAIEREDYFHFLSLSETFQELHDALRAPDSGSAGVRAATAIYAASPWRIIRERRDDNVFIFFLGLDVATFDMLCDCMMDEIGTRVKTEFDRGRRFMLDTRDITALALHYLTTRVSTTELQLIFGVAATIIETDLKLALITLETVLPTIPDAQINWPSIDRMEEYADMICAAGVPPPLTVFRPVAVMDDSIFPVEKPPSEREQKTFYNGFHKHYCTNNVFVFGPDGCILWCGLNKLRRPICSG
jgi:hypothetical protein